MKTSDHGGVAVHALGGENGPAYGLVAGKLAISNSVKNIERLIDRVALLPPKPGQPAAAGKLSFASLVGRTEWKTLKAQQDSDSLAWALADMDRLRQLDPKRYGSGKPDNGIIFLFGSWYQAVQKAPLVTAGIRWSEKELAATVDLPVPKEGRPAAYKGYVPGASHGAAALLRPPGTIASLSLWRDLETFWESRADLFPPETVQGFAQLDTLAGQFFAGREFGADVLGQFDPHWRLVVAQQDHSALKPQPDVKYPAFALVGELDSADSDFGERFRVAFQAIIGISNVDGNQKKASALELGSEDIDGTKLLTARYMVPRNADSASTVPSPRYNFTPATAAGGQVHDLQLEHRPGSRPRQGAEVETRGWRAERNGRARGRWPRARRGCSTAITRGWRCSSCWGRATPRRRPRNRSTWGSRSCDRWVTAGSSFATTRGQPGFS